MSNGYMHDNIKFNENIGGNDANNNNSNGSLGFMGNHQFNKLPEMRVNSSIR